MKIEKDTKETDFSVASEDWNWPKTFLDNQNSYVKHQKIGTTISFHIYFMKLQVLEENKV